jgi:hypothetical protein
MDAHRRWEQRFPWHGWKYIYSKTSRWPGYNLREVRLECGQLINGTIQKKGMWEETWPAWVGWKGSLEYRILAACLWCYPEITVNPRDSGFPNSREERLPAHGESQCHGPHWAERMGSWNLTSPHSSYSRSMLTLCLRGHLWLALTHTHTHTHTMSWAPHLGGSRATIWSSQGHCC